MADEGDEIASIVRAQRGRNEAAAARKTQRLKVAREEARRLAEAFVEADPSVRLVVLFGSVATGAVRNEGFDIDLAVDADEHLRLVALAETSTFRVDVIDLRAVPPATRDRIERLGLVLYGPTA